MNLDSFFAKVKTVATNVVTNVTELTKTYTPEIWSPEKQYINGVVAAMALMVYADGKVENEEVETVIDFITKEPIFKEYNMVQEALELYSKHIISLETAIEDNKAKFSLEVAKISTDLNKIKDENWKQNVVTICEKIAKADNKIDPEEEKMLLKIKKALSLS